MSFLGTTIIQRIITAKDAPQMVPSSLPLREAAQNTPSEGEDDDDDDEQEDFLVLIDLIFFVFFCFCHSLEY